MVCMNSTAPTRCSVSGCEGGATRRGMCVAHYSRWYRTGDATKRTRLEKGSLVCGTCGGPREMYGGRLRCKPCHAKAQADRHAASGPRVRTKPSAEKRKRDRLKRRERARHARCEHGTQCITAEVLTHLSTSRCVYCGAPAQHADHLVPLKMGGLHCAANLVPACGPCNRRKGARDPYTWLLEVV